MSFDQSFQNLLGWEGGYGSNVHDDGGPTNFGVTQAEYDRYRASKNLQAQSVAQITIAEAEDIYRNEYWNATSCGSLNPGLANCLFDSDVNSGNRRGAQWLQEAINQVTGKSTVKADGVVGPITTREANALPPDKLIDALLNIRLAFLHVCENKEGELLWPIFGKGWQARVDGCRVQSHKLAGIEVSDVPLIPAPKALPSTPEPEKEIPVMATTVTTPAAAPPATVPAPSINSDAFAALLSAAKTDITAIKQKIAGVFAGLASGGASIALAAMLPDKTMAMIVGTVGGLAGLLTIIIHLYTLFTGLSANNNSTILLFENGINTAQKLVGLTPTVWDNSAPASPAPAA